MLFITFAFLLVALSWALPMDTVIQFERRVLVNGTMNGTVVERIIVRHGHLKEQFDKQPVVRLIQDELLKMMVENDHHTAGYGTYTRLRECKMRGYQVLQLYDRFQLNGRDCLTLDPETDTWTVLMPEAQDLKQFWTLEAEHTSLEKTDLKEDCKNFIKQTDDTQNQEEGVGVLRVLAPVLATCLFIGFVFISLLISKRHSQQPGGVLGSLIHYSPHQFDVPLDGKSHKNISQVPVLKSNY
ncbi:hypothetical protein R3I94_005325 [Phoxinus phoxinus]